jgi:hypothetical protein
MQRRPLRVEGDASLLHEPALARLAHQNARRSNQQTAAVD